MKNKSISTFYHLTKGANNMKSIEIVTDKINDNAIRVVQDNYHLVFLMKDDKNFNVYLENDDARKSGIYILLGDKNENMKFVYIGQAEVIKTRLEQHQKDDKKPWKAVYYFGLLNGELEKTQRDYLEEKLIEEYQNNNIQTDNKTGGNTHESLSLQSKMKADNLFNWFLTTINDVLSYDIFDNEKSKEKASQKTKNTCAYKIIINGERKSVNKITDMVRFVANKLFEINKKKSKELAKQNEEASPSMLFATFEKVGKSGAVLNEQIQNTGIYFYNNFNPTYAIKILTNIAEQFGANFKLDKIK
jgi:hypothetical protein